jgi:hypothetical protein
VYHYAILLSNPELAYDSDSPFPLLTWSLHEAATRFNSSIAAEPCQIHCAV